MECGALVQEKNRRDETWAPGKGEYSTEERQQDHSSLMLRKIAEAKKLHQRKLTYCKA